jgi:hypothetical protein
MSIGGSPMCDDLRDWMMEAMTSGRLRTEYVGNTYQYYGWVPNFTESVTPGNPAPEGDIILYIWPGYNSVQQGYWTDYVNEAVRHEGGHDMLSLRNDSSYGSYPSAYDFGQNYCY